MHCAKKGGDYWVIAGAQVPRLKNETKQDATLTLRLSSYPHKKEKSGHVISLMPPEVLGGHRLLSGVIKSSPVISLIARKIIHPIKEVGTSGFVNTGIDYD